MKDNKQIKFVPQGKFKSDFGAYILKKKEYQAYFELKHEVPVAEKIGERIVIKNNFVLKEEFYFLPLEFLWGVYLDFCDSVGINLTVSTYYHAESYNTWHFELIYSDGIEYYNSNSNSNTRQEAQIASLNKAQEIHNNR
jgi:hypothetical protein